VAKAKHSTTLAPVEDITRSVLVLRGHRVLLDAELAALYGVSTTRLNQQVRRNHKRFPEDFIFQLTASEYAALMLQNATSKSGRGGRRKLPLAFTEHGAIMTATVLNSPRAVEMSVYVVRAFLKLREMLASNKELARRFAQLETRLDKKLTAASGVLLPCLPQEPREPLNGGMDRRHQAATGHRSQHRRPPLRRPRPRSADLHRAASHPAGDRADQTPFGPRQHRSSGVRCHTSSSATK
jgi:hypothetical protein